MASMEYDGPPMIRRWDGKGKETLEWNCLRRDPELFFAGGDCFVYLYPQGTSKYGPSFRFPSELLVHAKCQPLMRLAVDATVSSPPNDHKRRRFSSQSYHHLDATPSSSSSYSFLYLTVPDECSGFEAYKYHVTTRNFFAWVVGVPLVGIDPLSALIDLKLRMDIWRTSTVDNVKSIIQYMEEQGYADVPELRTQTMRHFHHELNPDAAPGLPSQNLRSVNINSGVKKGRRKSIGQEVLHGLSALRGRISRPGCVSNEERVGLAVTHGVSPSAALDEPAVPPAHAPHSSFKPLLLDALPPPQFPPNTTSNLTKATRSRSESFLLVTDSPTLVARSKDPRPLSDSSVRPEGHAQSPMHMSLSAPADQKAHAGAMLHLDGGGHRRRKALRIMAFLGRSESEPQVLEPMQKSPTSDTLTFHSDIGHSLSSAHSAKVLENFKAFNSKRRSYPLDRPGSPPLPLPRREHTTGAKSPSSFPRTGKTRIGQGTTAGIAPSPDVGLRPRNGSLNHSVEKGQRASQGDKVREDSHKLSPMDRAGRGTSENSNLPAAGKRNPPSSNHTIREISKPPRSSSFVSNDLSVPRPRSLAGKHRLRNQDSAACTSSVVSRESEAQTRKKSSKSPSQASATFRAHVSVDSSTAKTPDTWIPKQFSASAVDLSTKTQDDICTGCGKRRRPQSFDVSRVRPPSSVIRGDQMQKGRLVPTGLGQSQEVPLMSGAIPPQANGNCFTLRKELQLPASRHTHHGRSTADLASPLKSGDQGFDPVNRGKTAELSGRDDREQSPISPLQPSVDFSSMKTPLDSKSISPYRSCANSNVTLELEGSVPDDFQTPLQGSSLNAGIYELSGETSGETAASPVENKGLDADILAIDTDIMDLLLRQRTSTPSIHSTLNLAGMGTSTGVALREGLDTPSYKSSHHRIAVV